MNQNMRNYLLLVIAFALVFVVGYIDLVTPSEFAYLRYYFVPILMALWFGNFFWSIGTLGVCALVWILKFEPVLFQPHIFGDLLSRVIFCLLIMFITERLKRSYEKINVQRTALEKLELMRAELTRMLVHDLNTSLATNYLALQMVRRQGELNDQQKRHLDIAAEAVQDLHRMVSNLLDLEQMEAGKLSLNLEEIKLEDAVAEAVDQMQPVASAADVALTVEVSGTIPMIKADRDKIKRVVANLASNALKFTPAKGAVKVKVFFDPRDKTVFVQVKDNGKGIKKEYLASIFDKFAQVATEHVKTGHGLGLASSKMIVEAHCGRIWADSEGLEKGATVTFTLPLNNVPSA
jgi:signal transduction histidine kinase